MACGFENWWWNSIRCMNLAGEDELLIWFEEGGFCIRYFCTGVFDGSFEIAVVLSRDSGAWMRLVCNELGSSNVV